MEKECPVYMAMGMSYEQYWNWDGDADIYRCYREAHQLRNEQKNHELWLQGLYIYEALLDTSPVFHDFVKNPKPVPYSKEPYALTKEEQERRKERDEINKDKDTQEKARAWARRVNRLKAKQEGERNG